MLLYNEINKYSHIINFKFNDKFPLELNVQISLSKIDIFLQQELFYKITQYNHFSLTNLVLSNYW